MSHGVPPLRARAEAADTAPKRIVYGRAPSWEAVMAGEDSFDLGDKGPGVEKLQKMFNRAGAEPELGEDFKFGGLTQAIVAEFQSRMRDAGMRIDGELITATGRADYRTIRALEFYLQALANDRRNQQQAARLIDPGETQTLTGFEPNEPQHRTRRTREDVGRTVGHSDRTVEHSSFAPESGRATGAFATDSSSRVRQAEALLKSAGQWPPPEGEVVVIMIDLVVLLSHATYRQRRNYLRSYTGETAVFQMRKGQLVELTNDVLHSASHPGQFSSRDGTFTDVNGDNSPDIAHLMPGVYRYDSRTSSGRLNPVRDDFDAQRQRGKARWKLRRSLPVQRDIDHDGVIDGARERRTYRGSGIQFHAGNATAPNSVGCQNLPPTDYRTLTGLLSSTGRPSFVYLLAKRPNTDQGTGEYRP